jgi:hypothetical protein
MLACGEIKRNSAMVKARLCRGHAGENLQMEIRFELYSLLIVSSRFKIDRDTTVHAAKSATSAVGTASVIATCFAWSDCCGN